jgi:hypothetical protein
MPVFTIYLHMVMGRRTEAQKRMFLGFGYSLIVLFSFYPFSFRRAGFDYNAVDVRVTGVCLLSRLYFERILYTY